MKIFGCRGLFSASVGISSRISPTNCPPMLLRRSVSHQRPNDASSPRRRRRRLSMLPAVAYFVYLLGFYIKTSREVKVRCRGGEKGFVPCMRLCSSFVQVLLEVKFTLAIFLHYCCRSPRNDLALFWVAIHPPTERSTADARCFCLPGACARCVARSCRQSFGHGLV